MIKSKISSRMLGVAMLLLTLLLALPYFPTGGAYAQAAVGLSDTTLHFSANAGEPVQRTFTLIVTGEPITELSVVRHDLVDADTGAVILSEKVSVDPESRDRVEGAERFAVTISGDQKPGHYGGNLDILYAGQPVTAPLTIALEVTLASVPAVDADANSKNLTLAAAPNWYSLPFGRPQVAADARPLGQVSISLIQDAEGKAVIEKGDLLSLRSPEGYTPPEGAVGISTTLPLTLDGPDAVSVQVVARGQNIDAGEYNGTLQFKVANQPTTVRVPLKVQVKDGPLVALFLLAIGPIAGMLINWWNRDGKKLNDLKKRVDRLQKGLDSPDLLQIDQQARARKDLERIMDAMVNGLSPAEITKQVEALEQFIAEAQKAARAFLDDKVQPLIVKLRDLQLAVTYRDAQLEALKTLAGMVTAGQYQDLGLARSDLGKMEGQVTDLRVLLDRFEALEPQEQARTRDRLDQAATLEEIKALVVRLETVSERLQKLPSAYQDKVRGWLDGTHSLEEMERLVERVEGIVGRFKVASENLSPEDLKKLTDDLLKADTIDDMEAIMPPDREPELEIPFEAFDYGGSPPSLERAPAEEEWGSFKLKLQWGRLLVYAIVYLFTLAVGWITLYVASPTFGADPQDYVTIFLWGVASAVVGSQAISLQAIYDKTEEPS